MIKLTRINLSPKTGSIILLILSFSLMFLGFYRNQWHAARTKRFSTFQKDVEAYVIARMVLSRQSGIFSNGGLLGWGDVNPNDVNEDDYQRQYEVYLNGLSFETYWAKESHPGFQGIFFSFLDRISPFAPLNNYRLFRMFASGLFALTLAILVLWYKQETGWLSAILVLISIITSQWMTVFGRNLFFVSGFFYIPMVALLFVLQRRKNGRTVSHPQLFGITFVSLFFKYLFNGYDFILPTLGMAAAPLVYYGVAEKWNRTLFLKRFFIVVMASLASILASFMILSIQIGYSTGNLENGISSIINSINRRTVFSNPNTLDENLAKASHWSILKTYLSESYFLKPSIPYFTIMIGIAIVSVAYIAATYGRGSSNQYVKGTALLVTTWFSLLPILGWYIIFKSISYYHTHMNYLPWHMPFILFGCGLCGYAISTAFSELRSKH